MKPAQEAKILRAVLKRMDATEKSVPERAWFLPLVWALLVACLVVYFQLEDRGIIPPPFLVVIPMALGAATYYAVWLAWAMRRWPVVGRHLNRESIESRIAELGAHRLHP